MRGKLTLAKAPYIDAGAESPPGSGDDDHPDVRVELGRLNGLYPLIDHGGSERIEDLGAVQGDSGNAIVFCVDDLRIAHDFSPTWADMLLRGKAPSLGELPYRPRAVRVRL
jgi:hypothetical protein